eukprot:scaffold1330_cov240-Pinguiococcus_pyrenoidosus.AAC.6
MPIARSRVRVRQAEEKSTPTACPLTRPQAELLEAFVRVGIRGCQAHAPSGVLVPVPVDKLLHALKGLLHVVAHRQIRTRHADAGSGTARPSVHKSWRGNAAAIEESEPEDIQRRLVGSCGRSKAYSRRCLRPEIVIEVVPKRFGNFPAKHGDGGVVLGDVAVLAAVQAHEAGLVVPDDERVQLDPMLRRRLPSSLDFR